MIEGKDQALVAVGLFALLALHSIKSSRITVPGGFDPSSAPLLRGAGFGPFGQPMGGEVLYEHLTPQPYELSYPHLEGGDDTSRWTGTGA